MQQRQKQQEQQSQENQQPQNDIITLVLKIGDKYFTLTSIGARQYYARSISGDTDKNFFENLGFIVGDFMVFDGDFYLQLFGDVLKVLDSLRRDGFIKLVNMTNFVPTFNSYNQQKVQLNRGFYMITIHCDNRNSFYVYGPSGHESQNESKPKMEIVYSFTIHDEFANKILLTY